MSPTVLLYIDRLAILSTGNQLIGDKMTNATLSLEQARAVDAIVSKAVDSAVAFAEGVAMARDMLKLADHATWNAIGEAFKASHVAALAARGIKATDPDAAARKAWSRITQATGLTKPASPKAKVGTTATVEGKLQAADKAAEQAAKLVAKAADAAKAGDAVTAAYLDAQATKAAAKAAEWHDKAAAQEAKAAITPEEQAAHEDAVTRVTKAAKADRELAALLLWAAAHPADVAKLMRGEAVNAKPRAKEPARKRSGVGM